MVRESRVKEFIFSPGSMTASTAGLFSVFSDHVINGALKSFWFTSGNHTALGSYLLFESGLHNSGVGLGGLIARVDVGSINTVYYPVAITSNRATTNALTEGTIVAGSFIETEFVVHGPLRLVGSGLGDGTSGTGFIVRYI